MLVPVMNAKILPCGRKYSAQMIPFLKNKCPSRSIRPTSFVPHSKSKIPNNCVHWPRAVDTQKFLCNAQKPSTQIRPLLTHVSEFSGSKRVGNSSRALARETMHNTNALCILRGVRGRAPRNKSVYHIKDTSSAKNE